MKYHHALGTALSQGVNALLGGHPDESLSARAWRLKSIKARWYWVYRIADGIFGEGHCEGARQSDVIRAHQIIRGIE